MTLLRIGKYVDDIVKDDVRNDDDDDNNNDDFNENMMMIGSMTMF